AERTEMPPVLICVPALGHDHEIPAKLFEAALVENHRSARIVGPNDLGLLEAESRVQVIVVSALPPEAVTAARAICKRIRAVNTRIPTVVGLWSATGDLDRARQRVTAAGATDVVVSFGECFDLVASLVVRRELPERE